MAQELDRAKGGLPVPQFDSLVASYQDAFQVVDDVILKNYITLLSDMEVVPLDKDVLAENVREGVLFFKITELVYEKDEFAIYKFASVFNSLPASNATIFVIVDSNGEKTDFYLGVRALDSKRTISSLSDTLENAVRGQFPGTKTQEYTVEEIEETLARIKGYSIAAVSCVANNKEEDLNNNQNFVQGLEKLVLSLQGQKYTGIIIANAASSQQLKELRRVYEGLYTQLSPLATRQFNYGQNTSTAKTENVSDAVSNTRATTVSKTTTRTETITHSSSTSHSTSRENTTAKVIKCVGAAASFLGAALATGGTSLLVYGGVAGGLGLLGSAASGMESDSKSVSESKATGSSQGRTVGKTTSKGETHTLSSGSSISEGQTQSLTLTAHDKSVEALLARINKQLQRLDEGESLGMYECAAYFLSEDPPTAEMAATSYKAIMVGEHSGVEGAAVNSWSRYVEDRFEREKASLVEQYVKNFMHPVFKYHSLMGDIEVSPSSMVTGNELALHMGLPRKSVCGLPVIEHSVFGKEVVRYGQGKSKAGIKLGRVFNMGNEAPTRVLLDKGSLSMHTFVTGATGSGKSNTVYELIRQVSDAGGHFLVIEPAKGEYKHVFGNRPDVHVYGTNPQYADLLKINPFKFPSGIHVLEHVDRLIEIFNVCWPMYAAMPAVLKEALLQAYEACGWNLSTSKNAYSENLFPSFADLQLELVDVINSSAYSQEVKSNYTGSLVTRVKSLTNGLNGELFTAREIDNGTLFDENAIVDLSRVGSSETKALIMGILVMKLGEHRMSTAEDINMPFKHLTVLEEAHHILRKTSTEQSLEGANVAGKSVEMLANAIAEMRTYGEGFVIVDQSPSAVDVATIRNTNTKIIMRLPDEGDRRLAGKAACLKDEQLDEIAKLPRGVAVVYQNDWVEPLLCSIQKFQGEEGRYQYRPVVHLNLATGMVRKKLLQFLLQNRVKEPVDVNIDDIYTLLEQAELATRNKLGLWQVLQEYRLHKDLWLWKEDNFAKLSELVRELLEGGLWLRPIVGSTRGLDELTATVFEHIEDLAPGLEGEYVLAAAQCLLKAEAEAEDGYDELYAAWVTRLREKKIM